MKRLFLLLLIFIFNSSILFGQERVAFNGETLNLELEVDGNLDLLSMKKDKSYRFFVRDSNNTLHELVNTKDEDKTYFNEFRDVLADLTKDANMSTSEVGFGRYSLKKFIKAYNSKGHLRYAYTDDKVKTQVRIGIFGGITNHPFIDNANNTKVPYFTAELEAFEKKELPRQSGFFSIEHALESDDFKYVSTVLALGYRYRFINKPKFNIYVNSQFATYTISRTTMMVNGSDMDIKSNAFRVPFIFGIGSDIKISDSSYLSLIYNELFSIFVGNSDNFPINFAAGYKFNL
ncbi:hypothetical protein [Hyunsoonleella aestuarii]|uniref:Outer membrane protein beta-barrel domain-containing protein n=1 Tax=Hyunsoonleella aestuarii TaxID=912802 RepID=A0ABP8E863_9FLAO|nr:hypothetical protein [Hyunsoonleella aestuarii]